MRSLFLTALLVTLLAGGASAQMADSLREEFHDPEAHGVVIVGPQDLGRLRSFLEDPAVRIVALQVFDGDLTPQTAEQLLAWVRDGHSLWFYDARLAPMFGMRAYLLSPEQFNHKPEKGELGGSKVPGVATAALAHRSHAVLTGVGQVSLFMPELPGPEPDTARYGAIEVTADTVPLLQFALDSPALVALRRDGRGLIVFKCLLWTEPLSGDRFQANLLEFSAGYQVPGPAGEGKVGEPPGPEAPYVVGEPAAPLAQPDAPGGPAATSDGPVAAAQGEGDRVEVDGQGVLFGTLEFDQLHFETGSSSMTFDRAQLKSLTMGNKFELDRIETRDGKSYKGLLLTQEFSLRSGKASQTLEKSAVVRIDFAPEAPPRK